MGEKESAPNQADLMVEILRRRMEQTGMTYRDLEAVTGIGKSILNRTLGGHQAMRVDHAMSIANALGTSMVEVAEAAARGEQELSEPASSVVGPDEYGLVASQHEVEDAPDSI